MKVVTEIRIEMVVDGRRRVVVFLNRKKIEENLNDGGSYGAFLRAIRDETPDVAIRCTRKEK